MMKVNIRAEKIEVTNSIKNYIEEKISRVDKFFEKPEDVQAKILLKVKGTEQTIEVMIQTIGFTLRAEESHSDMYAAIDLVVDKLERQIRKNKNKIKSKLTRDKINDFVSFETEEDEEEYTKIVKRKNLVLKPMDEEEAILQMELLGHSFFVFKNLDTDKIAVLYKRKDGQYGLIDTN